MLHTERRPGHNEWLGLKGALQSCGATVELEMLKIIELDGHISTCRHPHIRREHVLNANRLFEELHHGWRILDERGQPWPTEEDELYIFPTNHPRTSTTA